MKNESNKAHSSEWDIAEEIIKKDGVVVLPTDTLYGLVGRADSKKAVERIYEIKGRDENKPFIVLINSYKQFSDFGIILNSNQREFLKKVWPVEVSVIIPCLLKKFEYLHKGTHSIAFRMIAKRKRNLYKLIKLAGPIVAPSVNPQGKEPAISIKQAKKYFGDSIDLYINAGVRMSKPSTLVKFENKTWKILKQGNVKIDF